LKFNDFVGFELFMTAIMVAVVGLVAFKMPLFRDVGDEKKFRRKSFVVLVAIVLAVQSILIVAASFDDL
jgi:hypothetical protein